MTQLGLGQGFIVISSPKCLDDTMEDDKAQQEIFSVLLRFIVPTHVSCEGNVSISRLGTKFPVNNLFWNPWMVLTLVSMDTPPQADFGKHL